MKTFFIILKSLFKPNTRFTILEKIYTRFFEKESKSQKEIYFNWLNKNKSDLEKFCQSINKDIWEKSLVRTKIINIHADKILKNIEHNLGGGGASELISFICLNIKPKCVVETGVAAGFSTFAVLDALAINNYGHLYSSDFPYFRISNAEKYIGVIVPQDLKKRWSLFIYGDKKNLNIINSKINEINFFHYDSDKSFKGRSRALSQIEKKFNKNTWILIDDIQDNSHFMKYSNKAIYNWKVFNYKNKWIGLLYPKINKI